MTSRVAAQYDRIAHDFAAAFATLAPFDRGVLASFARSVTTAGGRTVLDAGCGPGTAARELAAAGLSPVGLDRSAEMVRVASLDHAVIGDLGALPVRDGAVDAVCAWYSLVHTPTADLPALFTEFRRVLRDDGWLLLAFQTSAPTLELREAWGHEVSLDFLRHDVGEVQEQLMDCGYVLHRDALRSADKRAGESAAQAFVVARSRDHLELRVGRGC
ncbi:class I SAM-dependent methyltransferase [Rhodococcoides corynebacterioides]|uniref:Class I SAM-dependent methyltransferase n=1 Tax=Rhodococcoides corynebacterioides TaxID=53972 RepID=A0ABS7P8D0_9NOCA|nr:class I SAM-dependent methyltransferase [Rhodococcus corynebacterioides]MBY6368590.1 class I SAM-dependent methyltransferase [Rhodococcus corynebacterioides]MBY6409890.1 class I SAM-dependent methyltransferase [Rhodococcus corynebacterioides]